MPDENLIRSILIPGKVDHFRAFMQRLVIRYTQRWTSSSGKHLFFSERRKERDGKDVTLPTRGTWSIILAPIEGPGFAGIEAYELPKDAGTQIDFLDGYVPETPSLNMLIGSPFKEFTDMVIEEVEQLFSEQMSTGKEIGNQHSDLLPKNQRTRDKWREAYSIIVEVQTDYREEYEDLSIENPRPAIDDYRDAIATQMGWKPSGKTVSRIRKAGDAGLLKN